MGLIKRDFKKAKEKLLTRLLGQGICVFFCLYFTLIIVAIAEETKDDQPVVTSTLVEATGQPTSETPPLVSATEQPASETAQPPVLPTEFKETAVSQEAAPPKKKLTPEEALEQKISLDLRSIDIVEALKYLATKGGLNIITTNSVSGRVSLTLVEVPLKDVFDLMLRSNSLAYARQGEIYNVMTEAEYKALFGKSFFDTRQVKVVHLQYAIPEQVFTMLDALKSEIGRVLVDQESGNVLIMDTPLKIEQMQTAIQEWEQQSLVEVFALRYAKAKDVEEILKTRLDIKKVGSIKADERNNQVIVQTLPERMQEVADLIKKLDRQTKEVLVDTKIIKIKLSDQLESGIEWEGIFKAADSSGMTYVGSYPFSAVQSATAAWRSREKVLADMNGSIGSYPFSGTTSNYAGGTKVAPGERMNIGVISDNADLDALFKLLQTLGDSKVLANPKIAVVNNQEAKIHIGERQAYVTTTTTTGQTTSTISEEVQFVDVGIQLAVTPTINDDGFIIMKVRPEISSVSSILVTPTNNRIPIIDTSMTETTVLMKDNTTLIIGGMRKEERMNESAGLPVLGKIPFLNYFFKNSSAKVERTELLILMTPHIISGMELITGEEKGFGEKPGKDYQEYPKLAPKEELIPKEIPAEISPKPARNYLSLKDSDKGDFPLRE